MRLQFEVSKEKNKKIETLMQEVGLKTKKDLFNNAMTLLNWAVKQYKAGRVIASVDEQMESYRELAMPIFDDISTTEGHEVQPHPQNSDVLPTAKEG